MTKYLTSKSESGAFQTQVVTPVSDELNTSSPGRGKVQLAGGQWKTRLIGGPHCLADTISHFSGRRGNLRSLQ